MKKVLGLDLGSSSIGWAYVHEAENEAELGSSKIIKLGVRVNPLTVDEQRNFEQGKSITTNASRTLKRCMRRNLQRYKLRRENLIEVLKKHGFISDASILSEQGNYTTFETYRLRAKAAVAEISLEELARVLLMINKKRGYKSSRKNRGGDEGKFIDGISVAKQLYDRGITPGQFSLELLKEGKRHLPDYYRSDLQNELDRIWNFQQSFYPEILTQNFREQIRDKGQKNTSQIFLREYQIYTADNKGADKLSRALQWRVEGLSRKLSVEELAFVMSDLNGSISGSSGYLGAIGDRSKELYLGKQTVGQYLMEKLNTNPNGSLKSKVFYRQDYLDEFERIWETQAGFHKELTLELKKEIRDIIIFYQRSLKSQKGLISFCELESKLVEIEVNGKMRRKVVGSRVCPKSSPLFQEFKIWSILNNICVWSVDKSKSSEARKMDERDKEPNLNQEEKEILFKELSLKEKLSKRDVLELLFEDARKLDMNYEKVEGNRTQATLFKAYQKIIARSGHGEYDFERMSSSEILEIVSGVFDGLGYNTDILYFNSEGELDQQPLYRLWHLLYSFEGDKSNSGNENLINKITNLYGFDREYAVILADVVFPPDYGNLSAKAIHKILPYLKDGNKYSLACEYAGFRHSKNSLTKEEREKRVLKERLDILPKNTLRNPVVEKILNQMVHVVNGVINKYGKPDEIRIELARELKKNAKEREEWTRAINKSTIENEKLRSVLKKEFGFTQVSRNDIVRYKLYLELESRGFKTLYSNTYIPLEKLFFKEFDIEHIIPQSRLFDDSFSNKTIELRSVNQEKDNQTAYDYVSGKGGEAGLQEYLERVEDLFKGGYINKAKYNKLRMTGKDIPDDFIDRDLRDTQYIARRAKAMLEEVVGNVVSTSGAVTDRLREDWQLVDVMKELNWNKYERLGLTEIVEDRDGRKIRRIKGWTKRNDHRHHAMDALTIAFTKPKYVQYLNNLNARGDKSSSVYGIERDELSRDSKGKLRFNSPMPLKEFRMEAKLHLENVLVSTKAKNKVITPNVNKSKKRGGMNQKVQLTPRGQLHQETIYGSIKQYVTKEVKVGSAFNMEMILKVANKAYREALLKRLNAFDQDAKKAFTGKNSLEKNPIFINDSHTCKVPEKVKVVSFETVYTIRKEIGPDLKVDKVIDKRVRDILETRLVEFGGDSKLAFTNLDENPIWLNKEKGIDIKRVTISGVSNVIALHDKLDKDGKLVLDEHGQPQPVDFVCSGNNHHVVVYRDPEGKIQDDVVSFFEATVRAKEGLPVIDREYKKQEGWEFLFSMKQNEYFVFPNEETGFDPKEVDLMNPDNYALISPNLFRVQTMSRVMYGNQVVRDYKFRHHLETTVKDCKELKDIAYKQYKSLDFASQIVKVRIDHIGQIVHVGEY